ncbi:MAG: FkbM family methyltransferase [Bryobacteraceae bacterium]|nr:FkbM family methyltransferase [Bryobacteraceae bacterium]
MSSSAPKPLIAPAPSPIARFVADHRRSFVVRKFAGLARRYLSWFGNVNYDHRSNGEEFVLATLRRFQPRLIVDAGANVGVWTRLAISHCPGVEIHAFEISPPTYQRLVANVAGHPGIHCVNLGVSDKPGRMSIRYYQDAPELTTVLDYPHPFPYTEQTVEVTTGDHYAEQHGIAHIDMLKIDVEGMELEALNGFGRMLERRAIDIIQFEYGRSSIIHKFLLRDFCLFFRERGYLAGKIYPNYVDLREYDFGDEDFFGPNYLACREDLPGHVAAFRGEARP